MKIKLDKNWIFVPLLLILIAVSISNNQLSSPGRIGSLSIASGNNGGTYYYIAAGQAKLLAEKLGLNVSTQSTSGSPVENMTLVSQSPANLGIVTLDGYTFARQGDAARGFTKPLDNIRILQVGHIAYLYGLTLKGSGVEDYTSMAGKRVSVPPVGSTTYYMALAVLEAYGCNEQNTTILPLSSSEQADALRDGALDVAFMAGGISQATVTDLDYSADLKFLSIDARTQARLDEQYPFWHSAVIPDGTYSKQTGGVNCLTVNTMLACNADLDSDEAYEITRVLCETSGELAEIHASGAEWSLETTRPFLDDEMVQFHPGALRYYEQVR